MFLQHDFLCLWAAGRVALMGGNPYDDSRIIAELLAAGVPLTHHPGPFFYPPWSLWIFSVFSLWPLPVAQVLWFLVSLSVLGFASVSIAKIESQTALEWQPGDGWRSLFVAFSFYPVQKLLLFGQSTYIVLLGLVLFFVYWRKSMGFWAGIGLSLSFVKAHLLLPVYVMLMWHMIRTKKLRVLWGSIVGLAAQFLISVWICRRALTGYLSHVQNIFVGHEQIGNVTVGHVLATLLGYPFLVGVTLLIGLSVAIALALKKNEVYRSIVDWGIPLSLLTAPYAWSHDYVLLLLPLLAIVNRLYRLLGLLMWILLLGLSIGCWVTVAGDIAKREIYLVVLPLGFLAYAAFADKHRRQIGADVQ